MRCAGKWRARTRKIVDGKIVENHIGLFESEEEAACAYDEAARAYFGDYALTNKDLALIPTSPTEVIKAVKEIQR